VKTPEGKAFLEACLTFRVDPVRYLSGSVADYNVLMVCALAVRDSAIKESNDLDADRMFKGIAGAVAHGVRLSGR